MTEISAAELCKRFDITGPVVSRIGREFPDCRVRHGVYDLEWFVIGLNDYRSRAQSLAQAAAAEVDRMLPRRSKTSRRDPPLPPRDPAHEGAAATVAERAAELRVESLEHAATIARLKADQLTGQLVDRRAVQGVVVAVVVEAKQRFEAVGAKIAPSCVGLDAAGISAAIDKEIAAALADLARMETAANQN